MRSPQWLDASDAHTRNGDTMEQLDMEEAMGTGRHYADTRILQIETGHGKKAIVIFVPVPLLQGWHRSQQR